MPAMPTQTTSGSAASLAERVVDHLEERLLGGRARRRCAGWRRRRVPRRRPGRRRRPATPRSCCRRRRFPRTCTFEAYTGAACSPRSTTPSSPLYLAAITAFGSWFGRFQHTTRDYFLSGRSVPWWAVCCTVVATETSTLTFIGIPATAYAGNMTFLQLALGYVIGRLHRERAVHPGLLPRRPGDVVRAAAAAVRPPRDHALGRACSS